MLYDKEFLLKLDKYKHKVVYARITALTFQETPIEYIEGRVTQGSISIDGASAVRRTCSLTIAAPDFNYNNFYWGLNSKFKLEVGIENHVDLNYPDVIWFPQGVYLITTFNTTRNATSFNISISGKDKMCLLNGEIGGSLESSVDFGTIQEEDSDGNWIIRQIPIRDIIRNLVHTYAGEPYHNIIINDLDTYGLELLEYRYNKPLFLQRREGNAAYINAYLGGENVNCTVYKKTLDAGGNFQYSSINPNNGKPYYENKPLSGIPIEFLDAMVDRLIEDNEDMYVIKIGSEYFNMAKVEYGQTAGYRLMDLIYAGDLIANVGESLTSVLDKIKNMLVEFEYFYNLEGQFVFQKKKSFKETIWQFGSGNNELTIPEYSYEFYDSNLITAFNNNPNLLNLRNDYSIWGEREGISGAKLPIHLRYAIDIKPVQYTSITVGSESDSQIERYNELNGTSVGYQTGVTYLASDSDWREVIYQMALDYYKYNFLDDFELKVAAANPSNYPTGRTGYEQYYIDMQGFWRDLYDPNIKINIAEKTAEKENVDIQVNNLETLLYGPSGMENDIQVLSPIKTTSSGITPTIESIVNKYDASLGNEFNKTGDLQYDAVMLLALLKMKLEVNKIELSALQYKSELLADSLIELEKKAKQFYTDESVDANKIFWHKNVFESPDSLNFWFDFLDSTGELQQFSVKTIGSRPKSINDKDVKSIYFRDIPSIIYEDSSNYTNSIDFESGYKYIQIKEEFEHMFSGSCQGKSAKDRLDELIYQHGYCIESATITTIPLYHLEPNTRIYIHDEDVGLDGDYIVSKLTIPLAYNGTMQITATKAAENTRV